MKKKILFSAIALTLFIIVAACDAAGPLIPNPGGTRGPVQPAIIAQLLTDVQSMVARISGYKSDAEDRKVEVEDALAGDPAADVSVQQGDIEKQYAYIKYGLEQIAAAETTVTTQETNAQTMLSQAASLTDNAALVSAVNTDTTNPVTVEEIDVWAITQRSTLDGKTTDAKKKRTDVSGLLSTLLEKKTDLEAYAQAEMAALTAALQAIADEDSTDVINTVDQARVLATDNYDKAVTNAKSDRTAAIPLIGALATALTNQGNAAPSEKKALDDAIKAYNDALQALVDAGDGAGNNYNFAGNTQAAAALVTATFKKGLEDELTNLDSDYNNLISLINNRDVARAAYDDAIAALSDTADRYDSQSIAAVNAASISKADVRASSGVAALRDKINTAGNNITERDTNKVGKSNYNRAITGLKGIINGIKALTTDTKRGTTVPDTITAEAVTEPQLSSEKARLEILKAAAGPYIAIRDDSATSATDKTTAENALRNLGLLQPATVTDGDIQDVIDGISRAIGSNGAVAGRDNNIDAKTRYDDAVTKLDTFISEMNGITGSALKRNLGLPGAIAGATGSTVLSSQVAIILTKYVSFAETLVDTRVNAQRSVDTAVDAIVAKVFLVIPRIADKPAAEALVLGAVQNDQATEVAKATARKALGGRLIADRDVKKGERDAKQTEYNRVTSNLAAVVADARKAFLAAGLISAVDSNHPTAAELQVADTFTVVMFDTAVTDAQNAAAIFNPLIKTRDDALTAFTDKQKEQGYIAAEAAYTAAATSLANVVSSFDNAAAKALAEGSEGDRTSFLSVLDADVAASEKSLEDFNDAVALWKEALELFADIAPLKAAAEADQVAVGGILKAHFPTKFQSDTELAAIPPLNPNP